MSHLGERITDYLLSEMTASEKAEAAGHLRQCSECSTKLEGLKRTYAFLQASPDVDPPRPLVFEVEKKRTANPWVWRWLAPALSAVAASIITAMLMTPASTSNDKEWLAAELSKRDQAHAAEVAYWESQQLAAKKENMEMARSIQLLAAQKLPLGD